MELKPDKINIHKPKFILNNCYFFSFTYNHNFVICFIRLIDSELNKIQCITLLMSLLILKNKNKTQTTIQ